MYEATDEERKNCNELPLREVMNTSGHGRKLFSEYAVTKRK